MKRILFSFAALASIFVLAGCSLKKSPQSATPAPESASIPLPGDRQNTPDKALPDALPDDDDQAITQEINTINREIENIEMPVDEDLSDSVITAE